MRWVKKTADRIRRLSVPRSAGWILWIIVLGSPLPFGSNSAWARLALEVAFAMCVLLSFSEWRRNALDRNQRVAAALLLCAVMIGIVQIIPLPSSVATAVTGRTAEVRLMVAEAVDGLAPDRATLALDPAVTLGCVIWLVGLLGLAISGSLTLSSSRSRYVLAWVIVVSAVFQAVYGAGELLSGRNQIFSYPKVYHLESATGTFINRNHFAAYLVATLPFAMGLVALHARAGGATTNERLERVRRQTLVTISAGAAALIWIAVLLSSSRAGLAVAAVTTASFIALSAKRIRMSLVAIAIVALALLLVSLAQVQAPGERFAAPADELSSLSGRLPAWRSAIPIVLEHPVLGVGLGNFDNVYRLYQPASVHRRWQHVHNEWLEWLIEGGVALLAVAVGIAAVCVAVVVRAHRDQGRLSPLLVASSTSLVALASHGIVDFALRIPAIATLAVVVVAFHLLEARVPRRQLQNVKPGPRRP